MKKNIDPKSVIIKDQVRDGKKEALNELHLENAGMVSR